VGGLINEMVFSSSHGTESNMVASSVTPEWFYQGFPIGSFGNNELLISNDPRPFSWNECRFILILFHCFKVAIFILS